MDEILRFEKIGDYLTKANLGVDQKMDDFLIYSYDEVNNDATITLDAYRNSYYEMTLDLTAGCSFKIDEFSFPLEGDRLSIIAPNRLQSTVAHEEVLEVSKGYSLFFSSDFMSQHFNETRLMNDYQFLNKNNSPAIYPGGKLLKEIQSLFELIAYEYKEYGNGSKEIIRAYVKALFEKAKSDYKSADNMQLLTRDQEIAISFESLCSSRIYEYTTVKEYAELLNVSYKHLSSTVRKATGKRALDIINAKRIAEAKSLLTHTNMTLAEIAFRLKFTSTDYFITFFKCHTGTTPMKFRIFQS